MNKIFKLTGWVLALLGLALAVWSLATDGANVDLFLRYTYVLFIAGIVIWVGLAIFMTAKNNPKGLLKGLLVIAAAAVVVGVAYALASGDAAFNVKTQPSTQVLKFSDTMLTLVYLLGGAAICAIIYGVIRNAFNK